MTRRGKDARPLAGSTLALALLLAQAGAAAAPTPQVKGAELDKLRGAIKEVQSQIEEARDDRARALAQLEATERRIAAVTRTLGEVDNQLRELRVRLELLQSTRLAQQARLKSQRELLARQMRAHYALGREAPLRTLLAVNDPAALGRTLVFYDYLGKARAQRIRGINATLGDISSVEADIRRRNDDLHILVERRRQQAQALREQQDVRRQLVARLDTEISSRERRLSRLKEDERALQALVERLRQQLSKIPKDNVPPPAGPLAKLKGKLPWPGEGALVARYGTPRVGSLRWAGVVIAMNDGAPVRAVAAGRVVFADFLRGYGLLMIVDHGGGYMSLYGYNRELRKVVGESVDMNDVIATAGGEAPDPAGLYFELRHGGKPVDPTQWCSGSPG